MSLGTICPNSEASDAFNSDCYGNDKREQITKRRVAVFNAPFSEHLIFTASQALNVRTIIP